MYILIFLIFLLCALLTKEKPNFITLITLIVIFILIIGLRSPYIDQDYQNYLRESKYGSGISEFTFYIFSNISYSLTNSAVLMFVIYAVITVPTQFYALYKHSNFFWISLLFFFPTYFVILNMNAMRSGAALGITMIAWSYWAERKTLITLGLIALATSLHYSFAILFLFYPIVRNNDKYLKAFLAAIPIVFAFHTFIDIDEFFAFFSVIEFIAVKSNAYSTEDFEPVSIFSTVILLRVAIVAALYYYREELSKHNSLFYLFFKLYIVGLVLLVFIADIPPVAFRLLDIFAASELVLLPMFLYTIKQRYIALGGITVYAFLYFYINIILAQNIKPYEMII